MSKFMFVYRGGRAGMEHASPEQIQQVIQMWIDWIQTGIKAGWMLDGGDGFKPDGAVVNADFSVTDELFTKSKELIDGYSMVQAPDLTTAIELAKGSPIQKSGGTVEVHELIPIEKQDQ